MSKLRWRLVVALGVAAGLTANQSGAGPLASALAAVLVPILIPILTVAAPRFVIAFVGGAVKNDERPHHCGEALSGLEFEDYVAGIARSAGVPVIMTSMSGDWGVDLIVGHRPNRLAVQCKRRSRPVGAGAVQEVVAGAPMQDCTRTMVVTNNEFTPAARKLAELHDCELVGGADLARLRSTIRRLTQPASTEGQHVLRPPRRRSPRQRP